MKIGLFIQRLVAKVLLWPMDVVDYINRDCMTLPNTRAEKLFIGTFMAFWYMFFVYCLCSLLACLI